MPSPVQFNVTLAPLNANFSGTPAQWATEVANRLTITPQEPWNSFQVTDPTAPPPVGSNVGPVLVGGREWRVYNTSTGAYTFHTQNGAGLVNATVPLTKLSAGTAGSVLIYDGTGRPAELLAASGVGGQVLTLVGGNTPTWVDSFVPGGTYFEATLGTNQSVNTNGSVQLVEFDTSREEANVTFDTANSRVPVPANQVWFFYCQLMLEDSGAASHDVQVDLYIRKNGVNQVGSISSWHTATSQFGAFVSGIVKMDGSNGNVDVSITANETTPSATGITIAANAANTRFGGYRLI